MDNNIRAIPAWGLLLTSVDMVGPLKFNFFFVREGESSSLVVCRSMFRLVSCCTTMQLGLYCVVHW